MVAATRPLNIALVLLEMVLLTILASVMMTFTSDNPPETSPSCLMTDQLNCTRHWQDSIPPSTLQERQANVFLSPPNCYSTALAASVADTWRALVENLQVYGLLLLLAILSQLMTISMALMVIKNGVQFQPSNAAVMLFRCAMLGRCISGIMQLIFMIMFIFEFGDAIGDCNGEEQFERAQSILTYQIILLWGYGLHSFYQIKWRPDLCARRHRRIQMPCADHPQRHVLTQA